MKRSVIVGAAALLLAGVVYPILALDSHKNNEPAKAVEKKDESKATEVKPNESMAKDATATTPAMTETKPAVVAPSAPSVTDSVTDKTKDAVKDKTMDVAKDKAANATPSGMKTVIPTPSVPSTDPTSAATKATTSSIPTTPNVAAPAAK
jgi:hypothetical protein